MFFLCQRMKYYFMTIFFFYKNTMLSESIEMQMNILTPFSKTGIVAGFCWISVLNLLAEWSCLLVCMHLKKFNQTRIIITLFKMSSKPLIWLYVSLRIRDFSSVLSSMYNIHVIQTQSASALWACSIRQKWHVFSPSNIQLHFVIYTGQMTVAQLHNNPLSGFINKHYRIYSQNVGWGSKAKCIIFHAILKTFFSSGVFD